ncbi:MAG: hypothetical protein U0587_01950 [Candidatus Binatia bacterium]
MKCRHYTRHRVDYASRFGQKRVVAQRVPFSSKMWHYSGGKGGNAMNRLTDRMIRAARLDVGVYEEVEADPNAMTEAMATVVLSSLAAGVAGIAITGIGGLVLQTVGALIGWFVWAYLTYLIGTRLLPEPQTTADFGELLRTLGFASAPGVIRVAGVIPGLLHLSFFLAGVWMLIAMVIAVRQALDYTSTLRAVGVCLIGFVVQTIILAVVFMAAGPPGA